MPKFFAGPTKFSGATFSAVFTATLVYSIHNWSSNLLVLPWETPSLQANVNLFPDSHQTPQPEQHTFVVVPFIIQVVRLCLDNVVGLLYSIHFTCGVVLEAIPSGIYVIISPVIIVTSTINAVDTRNKSRLQPIATFERAGERFFYRLHPNRFLLV